MPLHPRDSQRRARLVNALRTHVPPEPPAGGPPRPPEGVQVFGAGPDWLQVTWRALGPGSVTVRAGGRTTTVEADGGPGATTITGLDAGSAYRVQLDGAGLGRAGAVVRDARTLPRPHGALLHRIATVSDVHLGSNSTGYFHTIIEKPAPAVPHPLRCFRAAVDEARDWGADDLVVKGDLVDASTESAWRDAASVLADLSLPVHLVPGNHEWSTRGDGQPMGRLAHLGHELLRGLGWYDAPGLRVVLLDTAIPGRHRGTVSKLVGDLADVLADTDSPALVAMHHQPTRFRFPTYLPPGIPGPEARHLLRTVGRANPRTLVTSGHTHRHRRRRHGPVTITEVGSPKDYPGTWAGYEVYEGGLVQVVRRIERPDCIRWTEHTRRAAAGIWQLWAPGRLEDRCFTLAW